MNGLPLAWPIESAKWTSVRDLALPLVLPLSLFGDKLGLFCALEWRDDGEEGDEWSVVYGDAGIGDNCRSPPLEGSSEMDLRVTGRLVEPLATERTEFVCRTCNLSRPAAGTRTPNSSAKSRISWARASGIDCEKRSNFVLESRRPRAVFCEVVDTKESP